MAGTVRTIAQLIAQMPIGINGGTSAQDIHDLIETFAPRFAELVDTTTQAIAVADTPQIVTFDTETTLEGFTHSGGEITASVDMDGVDITFEAEVANGSGSDTMTVWLEMDTGGGFVGVANSAERQTLAANNEAVLVLDRIVSGVTAGDKFRIMIQGTNTNMSLEAVVASGPIPAIPSAVLNVHKL